MSDVSTKARGQEQTLRWQWEATRIQQPGKLQTVDLLGLSTADDGHKWPKKNLDWDEYIRLGHISKTEKKWDDGLYVSGLVGGIYVNFLVDTGSTATIISKSIFDNMAADVKPRLRDEERTLVDVNNREITIYGHAEIPVTFGSVKRSLPVVVCDVLNEGILGQDFLMKNVQKLDLQKMMLITDQGNIQCWTGGEAVMVCSVAVKQTVIIPPETRSVIPITIPKKDHLAELGLVETPATVISQKNFSLIPGIVDTKSQDLQAVIQNFSSNPITLYPNMKLGTCESYYEKSPAGNCCRVAEPPTTSTNTTSGLPEHLVDLMTRSTKHLDFEESLKLKKLLIKFQSVFATSSDDLGRTDLVQHTINTGPANPIRQCPRRLPFGKREVEKQELEKNVEAKCDRAI